MTCHDCYAGRPCPVHDVARASHDSAATVVAALNTPAIVRDIRWLLTELRVMRYRLTRSICPLCAAQLMCEEHRDANVGVPWGRQWPARYERLVDWLHGPGIRGRAR